MKSSKLKDMSAPSRLRFKCKRVTYRWNKEKRHVSSNSRLCLDRRHLKAVLAGTILPSICMVMGTEVSVTLGPLIHEQWENTSQMRATAGEIFLIANRTWAASRSTSLVNTFLWKIYKLKPNKGAWWNGIHFCWNSDSSWRVHCRS